MEIRKVNNGFAVTGTKIYKDEIVIFTETITIISLEDNSADDIILNSERVAKIRDNSTEIKIN